MGDRTFTSFSQAARHAGDKRLYGRNWGCIEAYATSEATVHRMMQKDGSGNAGEGRWLGIHTKNSLIHATDRLVVLLGMENALVVDTPDALLVGDLRRSQEVRDVVDELNRKGVSRYTA